MSSKNDYIAVFDSGVGGISVLRELVRLMPQERYLYFGDSANAPYGTRPTAEVRALTLAAAERLMARGCKALVVACNTATAAAIIDLRAKYPDKIIIGIEPALKVAADHFPGGEVGVMATPVTLREEKFDVLLHRFTDACTVHKIPAPGLVELVERGMAVSEESEALLKPLLLPYRDRLDAVVLGCTHYPFAAPVIGKLLGGHTALLDGGPGTARQTRRRLEAEGLLWDGPGELLIENSSGSQEMVALCRTLLQEEIHS
ncbi:MAG: glutamate racemase [Candidatus Ventricola sp.]|nr:glutamate racemase [Candidatus Ventricola sp.]